MYIDINWLKDCYRTFNEQMFGNKLRKDLKIEIKSIKSRFGYYHYYRTEYNHPDNTIVISNLLERSKTEIEDTLIHEMIHVYQHYLSSVDASKYSRTHAHDAKFHQIAEFINTKYNRNITVKGDLNVELLKQRKTLKKFIILADNFPTNIGKYSIFCVVAEDSIDKLCNMIKSCSKDIKIHGIYESNSAYFDAQRVNGVRKNSRSFGYDIIKTDIEQFIKELDLKESIYNKVSKDELKSDKPIDIDKLL